MHCHMNLLYLNMRWLPIDSTYLQGKIVLNKRMARHDLPSTRSIFQAGDVNRDGGYVVGGEIAAMAEANKRTKE